MTIRGECSVELLRENEDGSADYAFNFPPEALQALTRLGILTAIKAGIEDAKRLDPEYETAPLETQPPNPYNEPQPAFDAAIKALAEEAGFATWGLEKYRPDGAVIDWACEYDDELVKFYHLTRKQAVKDVVAMFMEEHTWVKERHNYWHAAANMVKNEFLKEDDEL